MAEQRILLGVIGRPHGIRGLVHVQAWAEGDLAGYGPLIDDRGESWTLAWRGDGIAELRRPDGTTVSGREEAAALTNRRLGVPRDRLPQPAEEEFYLADLIGLAAEAADGTHCGTVAALHDYGAGPSLEIVRPGVAPLLLPFTAASVPVVDVAGGRVVVVPPAIVEAPAAERGMNDATACAA